MITSTQALADRLGMITSSQAAVVLGLSGRRVRRLLQEGRIVGAVLVGAGKGFWLVPDSPVVQPVEREQKP